MNLYINIIPIIYDLQIKTHNNKSKENLLFIIKNYILFMNY